MKKSLLLVHSALPKGGIETFFVRLATERFRRNEPTKILLMKRSEASDPELLRSIGAVAEVHYLEDILNSNLEPAKVHPYLFPVSRFSSTAASSLLSDVNFIHVTDGRGLQLASQIMDTCKSYLPVTVGVYHSREFTWQFPFIPFFEKANRQSFAQCAAKGGVMFFNDKLPEMHEAKGYEFRSYRLFPLGVTSLRNSDIQNTKEYKANLNNKLRIVSVGRLHPFKSYHYWMPGVVKSLIDSGIDVQYDIYGSGPIKGELEAEIKKLGLQKHVELKGELEYSKFSQLVGSYDLFVGSGTAIVEAASIGVPSIIAIESEKSPLTYGFFSTLKGFTYNEDGVSEKADAEAYIRTLVKLDAEELQNLSRAHVKKAMMFGIEACADNFEKAPYYLTSHKNPLPTSGKLARFRYVLSFYLFCLLLRTAGSTHGKVRYGT